MNRRALPDNLWDWTPEQLAERLRFIIKNPSRMEDPEERTRLEAETAARKARRAR